MLRPLFSLPLLPGRPPGAARQHPEGFTSRRQLCLLLTDDKETIANVHIRGVSPSVFQSIHIDVRFILKIVGASSVL